MTHELVLVALVLGAILYALLIRRRGALRLVGHDLAGALSASSEIAVARINKASRQRSEQLAATDATASTGAERRSGRVRRKTERRNGRGRRTGGDRRRGDPAGS